MSLSRSNFHRLHVQPHGVASAHLVDLRQARGVAEPAGSHGRTATVNFLPAVHQELRYQRGRSLVAFFLISAFLFVPLKIAFALPGHVAGLRQRLISKVPVALRSLFEGAGAISLGQFTVAEASFKQASSDFRELESSLGSLGKLASTIAAGVPLVGKSVATPFSLVEVGKETSEGVAAFARFASQLPTLLDPKAAIRAPLEQEATEANRHFKNARLAFSRLELARAPKELRSGLWELGSGLDLAQRATAELPGYTRLAVQLLGHERTMRYLVVFANNAELRPAGGFAGSFALLDLDRGRISRLEIPGGGSYDLRAGVPYRLRSPEPLQRLREQWEFQDTNWFADYPTSAATMIAFYEKSGGPTVDGALTLTTTFFEQLLAALGPVWIPERRSWLTAENVFLALQSEVESVRARKTGKPKAVLGLVAPRVLGRLFEVKPNEFGKLLAAFEQSVAARHLQLYLKDRSLAAAVERAGLSGEMRENPHGDFLSVVSANIGGGKSDRVIEDRMDVRLTVGAGGSLEQTLVLRRAHHGRAGAPFVGVPNISYVRFYVPQGSTLLSAQGFTPSVGLLKKQGSEQESLGLSDDLRVQERPGVGAVEPLSRTRITGEFGKTVFGNWLVVEPGTIAEVRLKYRLPISLGLADGPTRYTLLVQKQAGKVGDRLSFRFDAPHGWQRLWSAPESLAGSAVTEWSLDQDRVFALLLQS